MVYELGPEQLADRDVYVMNANGLELKRRSLQPCRCGQVVNNTMPVCWRHENPYVRHSLEVHLANEFRRLIKGFPPTLAIRELARSVRQTSRINDRHHAHYRQLPVVDPGNTTLFARLPAVPAYRVPPGESSALACSFHSSFQPPSGRTFNATWCTLVLVCHYSLPEPNRGATRPMDDTVTEAFIALAGLVTQQDKKKTDDI